MDQSFTTSQTNPINHIHPANCHSNNYCGQFHANQLSRCKPNKQRPQPNRNHNRQRRCAGAVHFREQSPHLSSHVRSSDWTITWALHNVQHGRRGRRNRCRRRVPSRLSFNCSFHYARGMDRVRCLRYRHDREHLAISATSARIPHGLARTEKKHHTFHSHLHGAACHRRHRGDSFDICRSLKNEQPLTMTELLLSGLWQSPSLRQALSRYELMRPDSAHQPQSKHTPTGSHRLFHRSLPTRLCRRNPPF
jgi:hypothetical protein